MKNSKPLISVVMSAYNAEDYIADAVSSIISQTFKDFEFIIIDDGSTDKTKQIISRYNDPRIKVISRDNKGLVYSLNEGIRAANGKYIARQDADDISLPNRLKNEVEVIGKTNAVLVSTAFTMFDKDPNQFVGLQCLINNNKVLKREMYVQNPFAHGATMFKKSAAIKAGLYIDVGPAEDYDLWVRLMGFGEFAYVEENGYRWRINPKGISQKSSTQQAEVFRNINRKLNTKDIPNLSRSDTDIIISQVSNLPSSLKRNAIDRIIRDQKAILKKRIKSLDVKNTKIDIVLLNRLEATKRMDA